MAELLLSLSKLLAGLLTVLAPFVLAATALARRDRRRRRLNTVVLPVLNRPEFRGLFSFSIRTHPFGMDTVSVRLWSVSRDQVWDVMEALAERLPRTVRFEVNGLTGGRLGDEWRLDPGGCRTGFCRCSVCR